MKGFIAVDTMAKTFPLCNSSNLDPVDRFPWGNDSGHNWKEDDNQYFHYKPHRKKFVAKIHR